MLQRVKITTYTQISEIQLGPTRPVWLIELSVLYCVHLERVKILHALTTL